MGLDLVRLQLRIASGEKLPLTQSDIRSRGHAIEVRVYAEDAFAGFLPSTGVLRRLRPPSGPGIREDSGMVEGSEVSRYYDPMISKLIVHAEDRPAAIARMIRALEDYEIAGVRTTIPFCRFLMESDEMASGDFHTRSIDQELLERYRAHAANPTPDHPIIAAVLAVAEQGRLENQSTHSTATGLARREVGSEWRIRGRERNLH